MWSHKVWRLSPPQLQSLVTRRSPFSCLALGVPSCEMRVSTNISGFMGAFEPLGSSSEVLLCDVGMGDPTRFFSLLLCHPEHLVFCLQVQFLPKTSCTEIFFFLERIHLGLCWAFVAACGLSLAAGSKGCPLGRKQGLPPGCGMQAPHCGGFSG